MIKSVKVLGKPFKVYLFDEDGSNEDNSGTNSIDKQEIRIKKQLAKESMQDTLLHEVMHAVDETLDAKMSERQITIMASGLLAVFKDNPEFLRYLAK